MAGVLQDTLGKLPLVGGVFGDQPQLSAAPLDAGTQNLIHQGVQNALSQTPDKLAAGNNAAADAGVKGMSDPSSVNQQAASTGSDPAMLQAIHNQYKQIAGKDLDSLKRQNAIQSKFQYAQNLHNLARSAMAQQQVQTQNYEALSASYQQNEMARAGAISSLINLGGSAMMYGKWANQGVTPKPTFNMGGVGGGMQGTGQLYGMNYNNLPSLEGGNELPGI